MATIDGSVRVSAQAQISGEGPTFPTIEWTFKSVRTGELTTVEIENTARIEGTANLDSGTISGSDDKLPAGWTLPANNRRIRS